MDLLSAMTTFVRVVDTGSLSAAARALAVSVPAVSRQLSVLEKEVGAPLLFRTTRRLSLTEAGRRFYDGARRTMQGVDDTLAGVRGDAEVAGVLTVSAPVVLGLRLVQNGLPAFLAAHPKLRIDLRMEDRVVDLLSDGVDIAIRAGVRPPDSASIVAHSLGEADRVLVAAPSYLRAHGTPQSPEELATHGAVVLLTEGGGARTWHFERDGAKTAIGVAGSLRCTSLLGVRAAALSGIGLAVLPSFVVADELEDKSLRALLPRWRLSADEVFAIHRTETKNSPRVRAFLAFCRRHVLGSASGARR